MGYLITSKAVPHILNGRPQPLSIPAPDISACQMPLSMPNFPLHLLLSEAVCKCILRQLMVQKPDGWRYTVVQQGCSCIFGCD